MTPHRVQNNLKFLIIPQTPARNPAQPSLLPVEGRQEPAVLLADYTLIGPINLIGQYTEYSLSVCVV